MASIAREGQGCSQRKQGSGTQGPPESSSFPCTGPLASRDPATEASCSMGYSRYHGIGLTFSFISKNCQGGDWLEQVPISDQ